MTRRPLCLLCLALMLFLCAADRAGLPLIRGNPVPENTASWIEKHPQASVCGEVLQTTENEFTQSIYLSNAYLIYQPKKNQSEKNQSKKISIENVKVFLKKKVEVPVGTVVLVSGKLERVEEKRNPGEFDSQQYYATQHIFYFMKKAEILEKSKNYSVYRQGMNQLREYLGSVLEKISGKESGIFQAIVLGDKSSLDKGVKLRYQVSGIVHVLAISGVKTLKLDIPLVPETRINWAFVPLHIAIIYILKLCLNEEIIPRCRFPCSRGYRKKYINWQKKQ